MNIYNKTITILNKLKSSDSATKLDVYYKTVLHNCGWYEEAITGVNGTTVSMTSEIKIFVPFNDSFLPYNVWKRVGNQDGHFTMSQGDVVILGEVEDDVTTSNIISVKKQYDPDVCEVRHVRVCDKREGTEIQLYVQGV